MTSEEIKDAVIKELDKEYFLIPKHNWMFFVGGFIGIAILAIFSSYKGAMIAVESQGAKVALEEIEKAKIQSGNDRAKIDDYAREIKNGNLTQGIIKSLKNNYDFQSRIKGNLGEKGDKGDSGVSNWENGQYINLENSGQKRAVWIGSSSDSDGIIELFDKQGNAVVRINDGGLFILKDNEWVEPYLRK